MSWKVLNIRFCLFRNLKKAQDSVLRTEKEIKDTEKEVDDLTTELKSLEDKAAEVVKNTDDAEVRWGEGRGAAWSSRVLWMTPVPCVVSIQYITLTTILTLICVIKNNYFYWHAFSNDYILINYFSVALKIFIQWDIFIFHLWLLGCDGYPA